MSKNPNHGRATSTGSDEQTNTEGTCKYLPAVLVMMKYLQQMPDVNSAVEEANRIETGIEKLANSLEASKEQVKEQKRAMDEMSRTYDAHLQKKSADIIRLKEELEETRTRLSKLMALRMTDNNPNIADLSDPNRPTKLAEQYGELYDNEWTDAFEMLRETGMDEKTVIDTLRDILTETYKNCRNTCQSSVERFEEAFTMMPKDQRIRTDDIPEEVLKGFKDYRKAHADQIVEMSLETFLVELRKGKSELAKHALSIKNFLTSCFRLCWMMSIQDPPIYLDQDTINGAEMNKDKYRDYTVTGFKIDYIVWPCIYIEQGGAVLSKGVAQCYSEPRRPASAAARLKSQSSQEENGKERPQTAFGSPNDMRRKSHNNQPQSPVLGFKSNDFSAPGHDDLSEPTNESSASEQTMETDVDRSDVLQNVSEPAPENHVSSSSGDSDKQQNMDMRNEETIV